MQADIRSNIQAVRERMEAAAARCGRKASDITLIAVSKLHSAEEVDAAAAAGITDVGENKVQEIISKQPQVRSALTWHLIGHLQTNKVKQAVKNFDLIHSVDSEHLLDAVDTAAGKIHKVQNILIQVNLAKEESKFGIYKEDLPFLLQKADQMKHVHLMGLMCIAPNYENVEECRPLFREMREIFDKLQMFPLMNSEMKWLSMGMTHDYQIAIEEGSNLVRIGTAIFGPRQY